jgi:hypothetical protein
MRQGWNKDVDKEQILDFNARLNRVIQRFGVSMLQVRRHTLSLNSSYLRLNPKLLS